MNSRLLISLLTSTLILTGLAGCGECTRSTDSLAGTPPRPARINHLAFFKLQDPADAPELIEDCDTLLASIPGIVSYYTGRHFDVGRTTIDSDYDVGFYVGFENRSDYLQYVEHPDHIAVVTKWKPRLEWLRVHDILDDTP